MPIQRTVYVNFSPTCSVLRALPIFIFLGLVLKLVVTAYTDVKQTKERRRNKTEKIKNFFLAADFWLFDILYLFCIKILL